MIKIHKKCRGVGSDKRGNGQVVEDTPRLDPGARKGKGSEGHEESGSPRIEKEEGVKTEDLARYSCLDPEVFVWAAPRSCPKPLGA